MSSGLCRKAIIDRGRCVVWINMGCRDINFDDSNAGLIGV